MPKTERETLGNEARFQRTGVQNLLRHGTSGKYYGRWTVGERQIWRSLKTDVFTVAKLRLNAEGAKVENLRGSRSAVAAGTGSVLDLMRIYEERVKANADLKPNSIKARISGMVKLKKTWPELAHLKPRLVTPGAVAEWAAGFKAGKGASFRPPGARTAIDGNSATSVNRAIDTLKRVMDIAVAGGVIHANPVSVMAPDGQARLKKKIAPKKLTLPSAADTRRIFESIEASPSQGRWSVEIADFCRFLFCTGCRLSEVSTVTWSSVDLERKQVSIKGSKSDTSDRIVPLFLATEALLQKVRERRGLNGAAAGDQIFRVSECQKSIDRACKAIGIRRITHHDFRHLFATNCIEAGVDIPTVSHWLGHSDGGALAMKTYGHLRQEQSAAMAAKVSF